MSVYEALEHAERRQAAPVSRRLEQVNRRLSAKVAELEAANSRLTEFASTLSHDLQQPLSALGGFLALFLQHRGDQLDDDAALWLGAAERSHRSLVDIVKALTATAMSGPVEIQPVELAAVVEHVLIDLERDLAAAGAEVAVGPLPVVLGDRPMLERITTNLLANACRYRHPDRPLRITIGQRASDRRPVVLVVSDNGRGLAPGEEEAIFKPGRRGSSSEGLTGTGTGLAIVRAVAQRLGGHVWAESATPHGARFYVALRGPVPDE